ncbi:MAG: hypothetical protein ACI9SC_002199 [Gammaproteobacteria bacterium]|jgi:hypothetical protein
MAISNAKVVGELTAGYITVVLNPDLTGTDALNNTGSELIATLPVSIVPPELREVDTDVWYATKPKAENSKKLIKKLFPMTSDEIPAEYNAWLEENEG